MFLLTRGRETLRVRCEETYSKKTPISVPAAANSP